MTFRQVWIFPLLMFLLIPGTFVITYTIAVLENHVDEVFPYISDTGTIPPESCVFGQLLNFGALFACITIYIRHRQIMEFYRNKRKSNICLITASLVCLWIGYAASLGMSIVANFQEKSVIQVHMIGAFLAFFLALIYGYTQTIFTYIMEPVFVGKWMAHFRLFLCILATPFLVLIEANHFASYSDQHCSNNCTKVIVDDNNPTVDRETDLTDVGYSLLLLSTCSEWILAICCILFFLTFAAEFRKLELIPPKVIFITNLDEIRVLESKF